MSQSRTDQTPKFTSLLRTYTAALLGGNAALFVGHPAERLKVAAQYQLHLPTSQVIKPIVTDLKALYSGFLSCVYRQNIKFVYRSIVMHEMPHRVDDLQMNFMFGTALKALFASGIDTFFVTPPENVKTWQMRSNSSMTVRNAMSEIYHARGLQGFFFGVQPTFVKSYPTWFYLFLGYHATKDKRQQQGFLATIFWATAASIPITMATNPLDVIKTQIQATQKNKSESIIKVGKDIWQQHGFFGLAKGFPFRLVHKSLATATAYVILDASRKHKI